MIHWRCLLLIYSQIDVCILNASSISERFIHELPSEEIKDAVESFRNFPLLVEDLTDQKAGIKYDIVYSQRALSTLTKSGDDLWWPSPEDTKPELEQYLLKEKYHSVFIFWPQNNLQSGKSIKSGGWGLGMGASEWSMGATYATVANTQSRIWEIPIIGEIWLHEWLHGVCYHFKQLGHKMPDGDADGGGRHGYSQSAETGWTSYYRDLMNGKVMEKGEARGIAPEAWSIPLSAVESSLITKCRHFWRAFQNFSL